MAPFNKIDRPHSTSLHKDVKDKPIVEDRTFILEDNPDKRVSLICAEPIDENEPIGKYFVLDIGFGIDADDFANYIPGKKEFFILPDGWTKSVLYSLKDMKKTPLQKNVVYFLDIPEFAQTLIVSAENVKSPEENVESPKEKVELSIKDCRGFNSAISLADWNFMINVSERTTVLEGKTEQNEQDIIFLQEKDIQFANDIASNQEEIINNTESILGRVTINPIHNWVPNIIESTNEAGEIIVENILEHFPLESSSITLTEGSKISFLYEEFEGYEGNIYAEIWTKGEGYFTVSVNGQDIIPMLEDIQPNPYQEQNNNQEESIEITTEQEENIIGYPAGGVDYQKASNFLENFSIPTGTLTFTITVNSKEVEVLLSDTKRLTFLQEANSGDGIKDLVFDNETDMLTLSTTTEKVFPVDLSSIKTSANVYTDQKIEALGTVFDIKGIKLTYDELPTEDNVQGDVWFVGDNLELNSSLDEYIWIDPTGWQLLGSSSSGGGVTINDGFIGKIVPAIGTINDFSLVLANGQTISRLEYPDYYDYCKNSIDPQICGLIVDETNVKVQNMSAIYLRGSGANGIHNAGEVGLVQEDQIKNHQHNTIMGSHSHVTDIGSHTHRTYIGPHDHTVSVYAHVGGSKGNGSYSNFGWTSQTTSRFDYEWKTSNSTNIGPKTSDSTNLGTKISTNPISGAGSETTPYSLTVNFYVQVKNYTVGRSYVIADPEVGLLYKQGDMIKIDSHIYVSGKETTWTGTISSDWNVYNGGSVGDGTVTINDTQIGMIQGFAGSIEDPSWHEMDGSILPRVNYPEYYEWVASCEDELIRELIVDADNVRVPNASDGRFFRNAGGNAGEAGTKQEDAIRNITGEMRYGFCDSAKDALVSNIETSHSTVPMFSDDDSDYQRKNIKFDASRSDNVNTDVENRPLSMTIKYYIKVLNTTKGRSDIIAVPQINLSYVVGNMILLNGEIYKCLTNTTWTGTLTSNWTLYGVGSGTEGSVRDGTITINDTQIGMIQGFAGSIEDPSWHEMDGAILSRVNYPEYYDWVSENATYLIVDSDNVKVPDTSDGRFLRSIGYSNDTVGSKRDWAIQNLTGILKNNTHSILGWGPYPDHKVDGNVLFRNNNTVSGKRVEISESIINQQLWGLQFDSSSIWKSHAVNDSVLYPDYLAVKYYIKVLNTVKGRSDIITAPQINLSYIVGNMILFRGEIYKCLINTTWTGTLTNDWIVYGKEPRIHYYLCSNNKLLLSLEEQTSSDSILNIDTAVDFTIDLLSFNATWEMGKSVGVSLQLKDATDGRSTVEVILLHNDKEIGNTQKSLRLSAEYSTHTMLIPINEDTNIVPNDTISLRIISETKVLSLRVGDIANKSSFWTGSITENIAITSSDKESPIGAFLSTAGNIDDPSYLKANGSTILRTAYPEYYSWATANASDLIVDENNVRLPKSYKDNTPEIINNNDGTAYKYPDGRLVCVGHGGSYTDDGSHHTQIELVLPHPFMDKNYVILDKEITRTDTFTTARDQIKYLGAYRSLYKTDRFTMSVKGEPNPAGYPWGFQYRAEGFWKDPSTIDNYSYVKVAYHQSSR